MSIKKLLLFFLVSLHYCLYTKISVEADASVFFPIDSNLQEIYGAAWPNIALSFDHISCISQCPSINIFAMVNYQFASGYSENGDESTRINLVPITLGLKWIQEINENVAWYLGAAPKYYFMNIKNNSPYVPQQTNENGCGAFITTGAFFYPKEHIQFNCFLNFSYMNFAAPDQSPNTVSFTTNVSGFDLGVGLGWNF